VDDEGFLLLELCANATHANAEYGALVLGQILALCEASMPAGGVDR
jgi:hypothetical protein